ncbi:hypothetical protein ABTX34_23745 [Streptomyces sp. NPDC096538]|uniref:hypothetical protein n=1 Tax=Streptomyces sp. NPDC096538 TaxID=3155427 RepID=UPI00331B5B74
MSATSGAGNTGTHTTLFQHALRLHRLTPDGPLFRGGEPFPDAEGRPRRSSGLPYDPDAGATRAAEILSAHLADDRAPSLRLVRELRDVPFPSRRDERIKAVALQAPAARVREAGRLLVRHGTEPAPVAVGLALLTEVATARDIPLIQTIGLLWAPFGSAAVMALDRLPGGVEALIWLAERVTVWGRVHAVNRLLRHVDDHPAVRPWLLRRAVDGDHLNAYFAAEVARATALHEVVARCGDDAEVVDHAGRLLHVMKHCEGMGISLRQYEHAVTVMEAHARHVKVLGPTPERYFTAASLAQYLSAQTPAWSDDPAVGAGWERVRMSYLDLTDRADWCDVAREGLAAGDWRMTWLAGSMAPQLDLPAFRDGRDGERCS